MEAPTGSDPEHTLSLDIETWRAIDTGIYRSKAYDFSVPFKDLSESDKKVRQAMPSTIIAGQAMLSTPSASLKAAKDAAEGIINKLELDRRHEMGYDSV